MENKVIHKASSRGYADHGWLKTKHTFSFANYYDPERMNFGALRVLNDDHVEGGEGFGLHPHDNMEIISIPLEGDLEHRDSMNNVSVIRKGDIQVMSAGTGIFHSEYNSNTDRPVKFLQIWVLPERKNVSPRYEQMTIDQESLINRFQLIVSPEQGEKNLWIHQNAWFQLGRFTKGSETGYNIRSVGNGVYAFIISGEVTLNGYRLEERDGLGIWNLDSLKIFADKDSEILLVDVPMINK